MQSKQPPSALFTWFLRCELDGERTDAGCKIRSMRIAECQEHEVALLDRYIPSPGVMSSHARRHARQQAGASTFLVAWRDGQPVGSCEVRWDGCAAPEVQAAHGDCPEINGLGVWPQSFRSQGIGTALIRAAEELARKRGGKRIGLGVDENNLRAAALYSRLGYHPAAPYLDRWSYQDVEGVTHQVADACTFMIKEFHLDSS